MYGQRNRLTGTSSRFVSLKLIMFTNKIFCKQISLIILQANFQCLRGNCRSSIRATNLKFVCHIYSIIEHCCSAKLFKINRHLFCHMVTHAFKLMLCFYCRFSDLYISQRRSPLNNVPLTWQMKLAQSKTRILSFVENASFFVKRKTICKNAIVRKFAQIAKPKL